MTANYIRQHLQKTLDGFYEKKFGTDLRNLQKAIDEGNLELVAKLKEKLEPEKQKYQLNSWLENELPKMLRSLKFGTHISKGLHSSSKGDNFYFKAIVNLDEEYILGSHTIPKLAIDANGNAAALPLLAFIKTQIDDTSLKELIISDSIKLKGVFHDNPDSSEEIKNQLKTSLLNSPKTPLVDDLNKHILWPLSNNAIANDDYINLLPLHPSSFLNHIYLRLQDLKFGELSQLARKQRDSKKGPYTPYPILNNLAVIKLGGAQPQNVSSLNSQQSGQNYLLPSFPPIFRTKDNIPLKQADDSFFNERLKYHCRPAFNRLKNIIKLNQNNKRIRSLRQDALDEIIFTILLIADDIHRQKNSGWSENYQLNKYEKTWLDPQAIEQTHSDDWSDEVAQRFAHWLNRWLQKELKSLRDDLAKKEYQYWQGEMLNILKLKYM